MAHNGTRWFWIAWLSIGLSTRAGRAEMPKIIPAAELPQPKTFITLHLKDAAGGDAIAAMSKATGFPITPANDRMLADVPRVTLDLENQPYWPAMFEFQRATGLGIDASALSRGAALVPSAPRPVAPPSQMVGAFYVVAVSAFRSQTLAYMRANPAINSSTIDLAIYVDPAYTPAAYFSQLQVSEATDEAGHSIMVPPAADARQPARGEGMVGQTFDVIARLNYDPQPGRKVKTLKGNARVQLIAKEDVWKVAELANAMGSDRAFSGGKYTLAAGPNAANPAQIELKFTIDYDLAIIGRGSPASPLIEYGSVRRAIHVSDALGHELTQATASVKNLSPERREISIMYAVSKPGDVDSMPTRLEWRIPIEISDVSIPVELHDLPLPQEEAPVPHLKLDAMIPHL